MNIKKHVMVYSGRFLASLEMTVKQMGEKRYLTAASPPLNTPTLTQYVVMSNVVRHLFENQINFNNFASLKN